MSEIIAKEQSQVLEIEREQVLDQLTTESARDFSTEEDEELRVHKIQESEILKGNLITRLNQIDMQLTMLCVAPTE